MKNKELTLLGEIFSNLYELKLPMKSQIFISIFFYITKASVIKKTLKRILSFYL